MLRKVRTSLVYRLSTCREEVDQPSYPDEERKGVARIYYSEEIEMMAK
jgi:hypothetical protein